MCPPPAVGNAVPLMESKSVVQGDPSRTPALTHRLASERPEPLSPPFLYGPFQRLSRRGASESYQFQGSSPWLLLNKVLVLIFLQRHGLRWNLTDLSC